jgi:D-3-phosphoglycerate dehydrogenase / 2-oxoglutarate reductase
VKNKILLSESKDFSPIATKILSEIGDVFLEDLSKTELIDAIESVDILWVRIRHHIDEAVFKKAKNLKYIVSPTTGLNHIDIEAANQNGVKILSLKGEFEYLKNIRATAEHTIGLILALLRNIPEASKHTAGGLWCRDLFKGSELYGKTIGLIGFGRIGKIVAKYLMAFDLTVLATDTKCIEGDLSHVKFVTFPEILAKSDILSIHIDLNQESIGLFGKDTFSQMKKGALLINTSRGEVIQESCLLDALENKKLAGAALDVLCDEHLGITKDNPLILYSRCYDNLLITPHIGGCTQESMESTEIFMAKKLQYFLNCG